MSTPSVKEIEEELQAIRVAKYREEQVRGVFFLSFTRSLVELLFLSHLFYSFYFRGHSTTAIH